MPDLNLVFSTQLRIATDVDGTLHLGTQAMEWWLENRQFYSPLGAPTEKALGGYVGDVAIRLNDTLPPMDISVRKT